MVKSIPMKKEEGGEGFEMEIGTPTQNGRPE
jgi:hypothetical protein